MKLAIAVCLAVVGFTVGGAFAAPPIAPESVPAYVDPLADPGGSVDIVEKLFRGGAVTGALIVGGFMLLLVLRNRVPWFSTGWRAVWCSAAIGGFSILVQSIQSGVTPTLSAMIVAVTTTVALVLQPKPPAPTQLPSGEVVS